jgi:hypothetical protein
VNYWAKQKQLSENSESLRPKNRCLNQDHDFFFLDLISNIWDLHMPSWNRTDPSTSCSQNKLYVPTCWLADRLGWGQWGQVGCLFQVSSWKFLSQTEMWLHLWGSRLNNCFLHLFGKWHCTHNVRHFGGTLSWWRLLTVRYH